mgnify:CR=1 FL=1
MTYLIDAWLDRPHPYLRILHRETGEICAVLEEDALDELRDQGGLDLHEVDAVEVTDGGDAAPGQGLQVV